MIRETFTFFFKEEPKACRIDFGDLGSSLGCGGLVSVALPWQCGEFLCLQRAYSLGTWEALPFLHGDTE